MKVPLRHIVFVGVKPIVISCQEYALALATVLWLHDKCFCFPLVKLIFELLDVAWKQPSLWKEAIFSWKILLHC